MGSLGWLHRDMIRGEGRFAIEAISTDERGSPLQSTAVKVSLRPAGVALERWSGFSKSSTRARVTESVLSSL